VTFSLVGIGIAFYLGGVAAVLPILARSQNVHGETMPLLLALRLAVCWPLHPWEEM
jgi:hypothetical protein